MPHVCMLHQLAHEMALCIRGGSAFELAIGGQQMAAVRLAVGSPPGAAEVKVVLALVVSCNKCLFE
eukprot:5116204-Prymnesium_polylepis.1